MPASNINVYDASAGRAACNGFRTTKKTATRPSGPDEILFRSANAPTRYAEDDIYAADRELRDAGRTLPDSDLLRQILVYVSEYYKGGDERLDYHSMDETALLAMGILIEEAAREALGKEGDAVLVQSDVEGSGSEAESEGSGR
ncbi:hypothetical protein K470DRAFT_221398 [Piedraia hortae CBS 480.64]|uniref:Uncharacterized protein n=1 Tax=Piedraia hortae CBS 480.64 TaxID=1314780 RepID=A0A6A7BT27_9PEZI|nr:hypothetical protein K470DRAFT_221398 [Piedraia hortae CBS 480.64]